MGKAAKCWVPRREGKGKAEQRENTAPAKVQKLCGKVTAAAVKLFPGKISDVRDILAADLLYILEWFELDLDVEDVMQGL